MNKVYLVTAGEYSEYHIVAGFSTKENAEEFVELRNKASKWLTYNIEPIPLDEKTAVRSYYQAGVYLDGTECKDGDMQRIIVAEKPGKPFKTHCGGTVIVARSPRSHKEALKAARDKMYQLQDEAEEIIFKSLDSLEEVD